MGKGSRNKKSLHAMDADAGGNGGAEWMTGPVEAGPPAEGMDTREAGEASAPPQATDDTFKFPKMKARPGPRGKRTTAQKKRKAAKMEKAMAVGDRKETKVYSQSASAAKKKTSKSLWTNVAKSKRAF